MNRETINQGIDWAASNKGFFMLLVATVGMVMAVAVTCTTILHTVHAFDIRVTLNERRLTNAEAMLVELQKSTRLINDEQLRRTAPLQQIETIQQTLARIENKVTQ